MKKFCLLMMTFVLVFTQWGQTILLGNSSGSSTQGIEVTLDPDSTTEQATFNIINENTESEVITFVLPEESSYEEKLTNEQNDESVDFTYSKEDNTILIERDIEEEPITTNFDVVLSQLPNQTSIKVGESDDSLEEFHFTINDPESNEIKETNDEQVDEQVEESEINQEETKNLEEQESSTQEEGTEENNDTEIQQNSTEPSGIITPMAGNLNADIDISPVRSTTLSGNEASYNLVLKLTGSTTNYTNAEIKVDLPITSYTEFTQNVDELTISGVTPVYDEEEHTLTYQFDSLQTGRTYETEIEVDTLNGISPDGAELTANAAFEADQQANISDDAMVAINTSSPMDISKNFKEVVDSDLNLAYPGSTTLWEIKLDIPKNSTGQMYLDENGEISITDTLPDGLSYDSTITGPEPQEDGNSLTWTFDVSTLNEQEQADSELFATTIEVLLTVDEGTEDTTQQNDVSADIPFIDDSTETIEAFDFIDIVDSDSASGDIEGNWYVPNHIGPSDGQGNFGNNQTKNPNPVVYDDALLGFRHGIAPLPESEYGDFEQYTTSYDIDPNLLFKELKTPGGFIYRPNADHPKDVPLENDPVFNILAVVNGTEELLVEDADIDTIYTRSDLGLAEDDEVSMIKYDFTYAPSGMLNVGNPQYFFEVVSGYTGEVRNEFNVFGVDGNGDSFDHHYDEEDLNHIAGPRTAQITDTPTSPPPTAYVGIELLEHHGGEVTSGDNRMRINLNNIDSSSRAMDGPLETAVLLPAGVTLKDDSNPDYIDGDGRSSIETSSAQGGNYEILSDDYNNSGRQLVKVTWNDDLLRVGNGLYAELDVNISEAAPNTLLFDVYGFSGESDLLVPDSTGSAITDTTLQTDEEDLNQNGDTEEPRLKSGNVYSIRGEYNLETEKLVKGELDEEFTYFGQTIPGGQIDYQLKFTNTTGDDISQMTLMDVLPSVGDLGITDNVNRGSMFTPIMTDSIVLPAEWQDKVDVFYSTAKNPERDDLIRHTDYPDTTTQLSNPPGAEAPDWMTEAEVTDWSSIHSFKIEMKEDVDWLEGQDLMIEFTMQAPEASEVDMEVLDSTIDPEQRAAWNSFAMATDHGQPVEPLRVGVYMDLNNSVQLTKIGEEGETLQGAQFTLLNEAGLEIETGLTTDENGILLVEDLLPGTYEFVETQAPEGYQLDETPIPFEIEFAQQEQIELTKENEYVTGSVELTKTGEDGNNLEGVVFELQDAEGETLQENLATDENGVLLIEDLKPGNYQLVETETIAGYELDNTPIEFEIEFGPTEVTEVSFENPLSTGSVELTKVGEEGETLEGAVFTLVDGEGEELETGLTTNEEGILVVEDLKPGNYAFIETEAPFGYQLDATPIEFEIAFDQQEMLSMEVENSLTTGSVELTKIGEDGNNLEGVVFELQNAEGETLQENLVTDENGILLIEDLKPGNYQLVETETIAGYELDSSPIPFEIEIGQTEVADISFENPLSTGAVELTKVGEEGDTLEGAVFTLVDEEGEELETGLTTNEEGVLVVEDLKPGNYAFIETEAPFGYQLDATPIEFEIAFDQQEMLKIEVENSYIPSSFELTKEGEDGELLEGVVFELQDAEENTMQEGLETNADGKLLIDDLTPGSYQLVETATIPGYEMDTTPISFDIGLGQTEVTEVSFENPLSTGSVELTKVGEEGESLEGAVFTLVDEEGEELETGLTTNEEGVLVVEDLKPGNYAFIETEAPFGYQLDATPIEFEIAFDQQEMLSMEMENSLTTGSVELTKTGEEGNNLEGVVFELQDADGEMLREDLVTDENGILIIEDLKPGNYQLVETETIAGYELDSSPIPFEIEIGQTEVADISFENPLSTGAVELTKVGEEGDTLEGAVFTLVDEEGEELETGLTTNEEGILVVEDLKPGNYAFIETEAPFGYQLDATPIEFEIVFDQQEVLEIEVENSYIPSSFELTKEGEDGELLEGVVFELQDAEENTMQEGLETNADGKLLIDDLTPGSYQLVETATIPGYEMDTTPISFDIGLGQTEVTEVSFENPLSTGSVELTKVGEEGDTLEGAVFTLVDEEGEELETGLTTNEEGVLVVEDLKPGNYAFIETEAPFGYQLDATPIEFEIAFDQQEVLEIEVENSYIPSSFELTKEGEDGELLEGVVFELQDAEENTMQEGLETNADGKLLIDDLTPGSYQLVETATIPGYEMDTTPILFDIGLGQTEVTEVSFENPLSTGSVELTKVGEEGDTLEGAVFTLVDEEGDELETGLTTNEEGILVVEDLKPGNYAFIETEAPFGYQLDATPIEFEIAFDQQEMLSMEMENSLTTGSVELTKTGEDGNNLEGVVFELQDADGEMLQEDLVTDENGILIIEDLKPGNYQLVETETIAGYELDSSPIPFEIEVGQTEVTEISFDNPLSTGAVELTKVDEVGESLEGAVFDLMDESGNILQTGLTTNENGKLKIADLQPGNYQLVETSAPFGYTLDNKPILFEIDFNQQAPLTVNAENERTTSSVELTKVDDETGQTLADVVYQISQDGEVIKENLVTDENGQIFVDGLKPGTYQFIETEAADGYTLDPTPIEFTIDLGQSETLALSTDNSIIKGDFVLTKVDFDNAELPLAGVMFELQDADGNTIREGLQTAENGKLIIDDLRPGQYQLVETGPLPGYQAHPPVSFTIGKGQLEAKQITITNKQDRSGVELIKLDRDNEDKVLQGAEFMLQDEEGNIVAQGLTTDQDGKLIVDGLKPGVYSFIETKAPEGYILQESPIEFTIELGQSERTKVTAYNQKEQVSNDSDDVNQEESNLPSTATNMFNYALFGGLLVIGGIFVLMFYRRRKQ